MPRQSISLTEPNAEWVRAQIDNKEYTSMSDAVNDLIRQARRQENEKLENIRAMLIEAEESIKHYGYSEATPEERLERFKAQAKARGLL
jgi:antitoxin ParD1/3/4